MTKEIKIDKEIVLRRLIDSLASYMSLGATFNEIARLFFIHGLIPNLEKPYGVYQGSKRDYVLEKLIKAQGVKDFSDKIASLIWEITIPQSWGDHKDIDWALDTLGYKIINEISEREAPKRIPKITCDTDDLSLKDNEQLHPRVETLCRKLYTDKHYAEAVEKSFKAVRDRLRELTSFETGAEAFGKGKLVIKGAIAGHVQQDFNEGVKFLCMAIDKFRNEKAHSINVNAMDPFRAYEYLRLSSLAMHLLDSAEKDGQ